MLPLYPIMYVFLAKIMANTRTLYAAVCRHQEALHSPHENTSNIQHAKYSGSVINDLALHWVLGWTVDTYNIFAYICLFSSCFHRYYLVGSMQPTTNNTRLWTPCFNLNNYGHVPKGREVGNLTLCSHFVLSLAYIDRIS